MSDEKQSEGQVSDAESMADAGEEISDHYTVGRRTRPGAGDEADDSHGSGAEDGTPRDGTDDEPGND